MSEKDDNPHRVQIGHRVIISHGLPPNFWLDMYHRCMTASWPVFFMVVAGIYLLLNVLFACIYMLGEQPIANLSPPGWLGMFFFSVETLGTVGYGDMHPQSIYAHAVATLEIFTGSISFAIITGVMFARFSRPRARIIASHHPVVRQFDGKWTLMIRAANARQNVIVDARAKLRMIRTGVTPEGVPLRRLFDLDLVREQHPMLLLGWNIMHVIDQSSPLYQQTPEMLAADDVGFVLTIEGIDETTAQTMQSRFMYAHASVRWNHGYVDLLSVDENGEHHMDFSKFHDVIPLE
jgi:inward rectifier potassium channel